ncbi:transcription factor MYB [Salix suchowensis]|nr:transcription factor MYB [Salix suchowensis]
MAYQGDKLRKGSWLEEEDERLTAFATLLGERKWDSIAILSELQDEVAELPSPNLKRGHISAEEEQIVIQLHGQWGNKWARIARRLPGRTDNEIKNYWRTHLRKKTREEGALLYQNGDSTSAWKYSIRDYNSADDHIIGPTDFSLEHYELPCMTYLNSSYETRLYDWIPKLSNDQSQAEIHDGEGNGLDWCFCDPAWKL